MKTTTIWLDQCVPGMRVAETITNSFMATVVDSGAVLDEHIIEKLKGLNLSKLRIYSETDAAIAENSVESVRKEYRVSVDAVRDVLHGVAQGKAIDIPAIAEISGTMMARREDVAGILDCLNQVRNADEYTYSHCVNVALISLLIAKWMGLPEKTLNEVLEAGLLHDVGKCQIPLEILNKPSRLTEEEFAIMKKHPYLGFQILEKTQDALPSTSLAALQHHEKINGRGYPLGRTGDKVHLFGKICAVADIYDAMTSNRVYHRKSSPFSVFEMLEQEAFGTLQPDIVLSFLQNLAGNYVGDRVRLSNGSDGVVVFINPRAVSRPVVQVGESVVNLDDSAYKDIVVDELY